MCTYISVFNHGKSLLTLVTGYFKFLFKHDYSNDINNHALIYLLQSNDAQVNYKTVELLHSFSARGYCGFSKDNDEDFKVSNSIFPIIWFETICSQHQLMENRKEWRKWLQFKNNFPSFYEMVVTVRNDLSSNDDSKNSKNCIQKAYHSVMKGQFSWILACLLISPRGVR